MKELANNPFASTSKARWVWHDKLSLLPRNQYVLFRSEITLTSRARSAVALLSADARYRLFVNGEPVHYGPARSYPQQQCIDQIDLAPFLLEGKNVIAVVAHQFGIGTFQTVWREASGFIFDAVIRCDDGTTPLSTPAGWMCKQADMWKRDVARQAIQLGFQEHYNCAAEPVGWMEAGFVPQAFDGWKQPVDIGPPNVHPWVNPILRPVPLLRQESKPFSRIVGTFTGANTRGHKVAMDVYKLVESESVEKAPNALVDANKMLIDDDEPAIIPPPEPGKFAALVLETTGYCTGHLIIDIADAAGGELIDIVYNEAIARNGWLQFNSVIGGGAQTASRLRCRPGAQRWESFHFTGMRYVALVFRNIDRPLTLRFAGTRSVQADLDRPGQFECSDAKLNKIWAMCLETQKACLLDTFVDCPWREQAMWWGDARVQAAVTAHAFGDTSILEYGNRLMAQSQTADGSMHAHPPSDWASHRLPDFMCNWVSTVWDHYWLTGRIDAIRDALPALHGLLRFMASHARPDGLIGGFDGWWVFLDWAELHKTDYSALLNMVYLQALEHASTLFMLAGDPPSSVRCSQAASVLRESIINCFWDEKRQLFLDGLDASVGKPIDLVSQQTNALAILLNLKPEHHPSIAKDVLLKPARQSKPGIVTATPFFYAYVFEAMLRAGLRKEVIKIITEKWGGWVDSGMVTCAETWKPIPLSQCHAWSASPLYLLMQEVLGVRAIEAGFRKLRIAPLPGKLDFARGTMPTPLGPVKVEWESADDQIAVRVELPEGIDAEFISPAGQKRLLKAGIHQFQA